MFFSPLTHFEPIQVFTIQSGTSILSIDNMTITILLTFMLMHSLMFFSVYRKPFFPTKLQNAFERLIGALYPQFSEKPFKIYRGLIPFFLALFLTLAFFNLITLYIPLFYPLATQFFITLYLAGVVMGSVFLILVYRYRGLVWYAFTVNSDIELISVFLFFIEVFSFTMRLFSLSARLALNMFSGHMLLFLITNVSFHVYNLFGFTPWMVSIPLVIFLQTLETFVAVLQAYVFTYLSILYFREAIG